MKLLLQRGGCKQAFTLAMTLATWRKPSLCVGKDPAFDIETPDLHSLLGRTHHFGRQFLEQLAKPAVESSAAANTTVSMSKVCERTMHAMRA
jgi:hypothetical protein